MLSLSKEKYRQHLAEDVVWISGSLVLGYVKQNTQHGTLKVLAILTHIVTAYCMINDTTHCYQDIAYLSEGNFILHENMCILHFSIIFVKICYKYYETY